MWTIYFISLGLGFIICTMEIWTCLPYYSKSFVRIRWGPGWVNSMLMLKRILKAVSGSATLGPGTQISSFMIPLQIQFSSVRFMQFYKSRQKSIGDQKRLGLRQTWVWVLALLLPGCVILGKLLSLSGPWFSYLQNEYNTCNFLMKLWGLKEFLCR